jgi:hypothetical protein
VWGEGILFGDVTALCMCGGGDRGMQRVKSADLVRLSALRLGLPVVLDGRV